MDAGIEIRVVADRSRQMDLAIREMQEMRLHPRALRGALAQELGKPLTQSAARCGAERHEGVQCGARHRLDGAPRLMRQKSRRQYRRKVERLVSDGDRSALSAAFRRDDAEGQVLDREVWMSVRGDDPARQAPIVSGIELQSHAL